MRPALLFLLLLPLSVASQQTLGMPDVVNYPKQVYRGGAQTRRVVQDSSGILYFANDEGVLRFDGMRWALFPLPNHSLVRCLAFGPDGQLYAGGQDEVGYFKPQENGSLRFISLKSRLPADKRSFSDVWEIAFTGNEVLFQTSQNIYRLGQNRTLLYPDEYWRFMGMVGNRILAQSKQRGLLEFAEGAWREVAGVGENQLPPDCQVTSTTALTGDRILITTLRHGLFQLHQSDIIPWATEHRALFEQANISGSGMVNADRVAIGTSLNGLYILDLQGNIVHQFSREEGLQHNNVLATFLDHQKNIWLALRNGIDFIPYNNAITKLHSGGLNEGTGYSSAVFKGQLYLATSAGLFKAPAENISSLNSLRTAVRAVPGTLGDAWNLSQTADRLLLGHNDGAFIVNEAGTIPLDPSVGYWNFKQLPFNDSIIAAGTYRGLSFFRKQRDVFSRMNAEVNVESARFVVAAFGKVWLSHPYKGIYAVTYANGKSTVKQYGAAEGIAEVNENYLFSVGGKLVLTAKTGVYHYEEKADRFVTDEFLNKHLPKAPIRYLQEDHDGNVWFVVEKQIGVLDISGTVPQLVYFPELTNKFVAGFEHINPLNASNVLIGGEKGFYHLNYRSYKEQRAPMKTLVSRISISGTRDSILRGGYGGTVLGGITATGEDLQISHNNSSLRFEFASPVYGQLQNIEYTHKLEGFDNEWSAYDGKGEKEYTGLPAGSYSFLVKSRNNLGNESEVVSVPFTILPPWYQTTFARLIYILLAAAAIYFLIRWEQSRFRIQQRRHRLQQERLQYMHKLEMESAEKELVELRNARLEAEIQAKNNELASAAMHLVQKSDVLQKVKEQMSKLKDAGPAMENASDLKRILKTLNEEHKIDEEWQQFSQHFDVVHRNFLSTLKKQYPTLTPNEQKLSAYLKMNLNTKEIAQLMNISPRGVEISRYRLRKKLQVPAGMHLSNFLDSVEQ